MQQAMDPKLTKHNFIALIVEGALFWAAWAFVDASTVISLFIYETTGSQPLAGFADTVRNAGFIIAQTVMGLFIYALPSRSRFMKIGGFLTRPMLILIVPFIFGGLWGPPVAYLFILFVSLFFIGDGMLSLSWMEIFSATIPGNKRGMITGWNQIISGICGIGATAFSAAMLSSTSIPRPHQFGYLFLVGGIIMLLNSFALSRIRDLPPEQITHKPPLNLGSYVSTLLKLFRGNKFFRNMMAARFCHQLAMAMMPMLIIFGKDILHIDGAQTGTLVTLSVFGQMAGGIVWGQMSTRIGNRPVMALSALCSAVVLFMGLISYTMGASAPFGMLCAMIFMMKMNACAWLGYTNHVIDNVEADDRAFYLVMQGLIYFPTTFGPVLVGLAAASIGYGWAFGILLCVALTGLTIILTRIGWRPRGLDGK